MFPLCNWCHYLLKYNYKKKFNDNKLIHCDLKTSNIVIDIRSNEEMKDVLNATIIDFGLLKESDDKYDIVSTNFITSPESLLTIHKYDNYITSDDFEKLD